MVCKRLVNGFARLEFSYDDRWLVTASSDTNAQVWDVETGTAVSPPFHHDQFVLDGTPAPDGKLLATLTAEGTHRIWEVQTGDLLLTLRGGFNGPSWFDAPGRTLIVRRGALQRFSFPRYDGPASDIDRIARLLVGQYLDENEGVAFVPIREFIEHSEEYQQAWLRYRK